MSGLAQDAASDCPLCQGEGGELIWRGPWLRLVHVQAPGFPIFYRLLWNAHRAEFTDLSEPERRHCMQALALVEQAIRRHAAPDKVNLASLGNMVAHLHWHVVGRYRWDSHFPAAIWAAPQRPRQPQREEPLAQCLPALHAALRADLQQWSDLLSNV